MPRSRKGDIHAKLRNIKIPDELRDDVEAILDADDEQTVYVDDAGNKHVAFDNSFGDLVLQSSLRELSEYMAEIADRELESLRLFVPMKKQKQFLEAKNFVRLLLGGNRSGKTITTHYEMARILTNAKKNFRKTGEMYLVGKDLAHIGAVCWKKLTAYGPFFIIRDPETNAWRPYLPNNKWDVENKHLRRPAPPLIPKRFYDDTDIDWEERKSRIPKGCTFHSFDAGQEQIWHLTCLSSKASPRQGFDIDVGVFDEEIIGDEWFEEMVRGLTDREGIFIWGATAQHSTRKLWELYEKATKPSKRDPDYFAIVLNSMHNEFIGKREMQRFANTLSAAQRRVRIEGGFAINNLQVYPDFDPEGAHGVAAHEIPQDWTIYVAVDPGRQRLAALFVAVPPDDVPKDQRFIEAFAELYIERGTPDKFGRGMKRILGDRIPEAIIIDHQMGRQGSMVTGESVEWHYAQALKKFKVRARRTGYGFQWGSTDIAGRENSLHQWLRIRGSGQPRFKVHKGRCPSFCEEMPHQIYDKNKDGKSVRVDKDNHLVTCAEYLAAAKIRWMKPEAKKKAASPLVAIKERMDKFFSKSDKMPSQGVLGPRGDSRKRARR
jgi:hypothetical protein